MTVKTVENYVLQQKQMGFFFPEKIMGLNGIVHGISHGIDSDLMGFTRDLTAWP